MPFSVMVDVGLDRTYPTEVLAQGWATIDGHFVVEIHARDEEKRPTSCRS